MDLVEKGSTETEMRVELDTHILGKIGEFGQPVIRKKTDAMLQDFAKTVSEQLGGQS
jgi:carbon monoxide dehydrogenase subunit G